MKLFRSYLGSAIFTLHLFYIIGHPIDDELSFKYVLILLLFKKINIVGANQWRAFYDVINTFLCPILLSKYYIMAF